jgi:very-short-patch-repair endonuclease
MVDVPAIVTALGGMAQKQQLVAAGARDLELTAAVRRGLVHRARQGWYTNLDDSDPRVRAVRVGGRLTGISAVIAAGGWALGHYPLHVSVHDNAARLRTPWNSAIALRGRRVEGLELHWDDDAVAARGTATAVDIRDALVRVVIDESLETAVAALDWAYYSGSVDRIDFEEIMLLLPGNRRYVGDWVDERSDSLPESLSRVRLRLRGHTVVSQRRLGDVEHIDLVVDGIVALETDGREHHAEAFERDRSKDLDITIDHLHSVRASATAVFHDWPRVLLAIETALDDRRTARGSANSGVELRHPVGSREKSRVGARRSGRSPEFPRKRGNTRAAARLDSG